jgi:hypothetical protein
VREFSNSVLGTLVVKIEVYVVSAVIFLCTEFISESTLNISNIHLVTAVAGDTRSGLLK